MQDDSGEVSYAHRARRKSSESRRGETQQISDMEESESETRGGLRVPVLSMPNGRDTISGCKSQISEIHYRRHSVTVTCLVILPYRRPSNCS